MQAVLRTSTLAAALAAALAACASNPRTIEIPDAVVEDPDKPSRPETAMRPYVVKMSDGRRTWQIEIPVSPASPAFSARIPLDLGAVTDTPPAGPASEADREIIDAKKKAGEEVPAAAADGAEVSSYLQTLARVRALYQRRQYELALVELVALDREYPDDARILSMKGTLYRKLGRLDEARRAWERVLVLDPDDRAVARALEGLEGS